MIALIPAKGTSNLNSISQMRRKSEILHSLPYDSLAFGTLSYPITDIGYEGTPAVTSFKLEQNYPNPFNPSTTIKFTVSSNVKGEMSNVSLKVYDILGNEIETLVNEEKLSGNYQVTFDASKLASGVYFYRMQAGSYFQTKKMILVK
ncbi:MAG: T9SS type A sorting domain-containing protein [Ignavibacteriaceae bacterium]|nr:T9SS type A sorting domain-containing protein [Ignavibacteriaceae bacterium]